MSVTYRGKTYYHFIDGGNCSEERLEELARLGREEYQLKQLGNGPALDRINQELQELRNYTMEHRAKQLAKFLGVKKLKQTD